MYYVIFFFSVQVYPSERNEVIKYGSREEMMAFWTRKLQDNGVKLT